MDLLARAAVTLVDAAKKLQTLQVTRYIGEVLDGIKHYEPYGLTAHPHAGASALVMPVGGSSDATVCLVVADSRYRIKGLAEGEVCLYDDQGQTVTITRTGIVVKSTLGITLDGDVAVTGDTVVAGDVAVTGGVATTGNNAAASYSIGAVPGQGFVLNVLDTVLGPKVLTFVGGILTVVA